MGKPSAQLVLQLGLVAIVCLASLAYGVRPNDFKKCADSSFCRRTRRLSSYVESQSTTSHPFKSPYYIASASTHFQKSDSTLSASIKSALHPQIDFELKVNFYQDGTSRVMMDQTGHRYGDWKRFDGAASWAIDQQPVPASGEDVHVHIKEHETTVEYGPGGINKLHLTHMPIKAVFSQSGVPQVVLNERGLLHMEHYRPKPDPFPSPSDDEEKSALFLQSKKRSFESVGYNAVEANHWAGFEEEDRGEWQESFGGKEDSKPKGPEALSLDIEFPGKEHVYGLPEHASPLNLRSTRGQKDEDYTDPYRLMNTDVFEYDYNSPMSLYGSIPVMHAQGPESAASILWLAASETWIDIDRDGSNTRAHFFSESGILDLFIFLDKTPSANLATYSNLVGRTPLPAYFAIGYHQCRWNYLTTDDILTVNARFTEEDIPVDVLWLDIEYAKKHWYGVWNEETFAKPERMLEGLDAEGRKLVIIIDPHLARNNDYYLYKEGEKQDVFVKMGDLKTDYEGWCWSGSASWIDGLNPAFWSWWVTQFSLAGKKLRANAKNMHFWLDMNEPAIFNGPEVTAPKDVKHYGGWEHRDIHNIYSVAYHNASTNAIKLRETPHHRPFTLARGWWIGTWKAGAIWTGDNLGTWEHLAVSVPMILANNIGGMSFCGADVGGFFGNPSPDFLVRWYQAGIFEPFFRAHAHIDTKRREPYLLEEPLKSAVRDLIKLRYKMLPLWYTAFKESGHGGLPVLRPQFLMFPHDVNGYAIDDQYYIGDSGLLVHPAVKEGITSVDVYLAEEQPYYNFFTQAVYYGSSSGKRVSVPAPLTSQVPLLQRGGSILPIRARVRRAAELGWRDPFTLIIALNKPTSSSSDSVRATGKLYLDDGDTYGYEGGDYVWKRVEWHSSPSHPLHTLHSRDETATSTQLSSNVRAKSDGAFAQAIADVRVERIVVLGLDKAPKSVKVGEDSLHFTWSAGVSANGSLLGGKASELVVKDPRVLIAQDWDIHFE